MSQTVIAIIVAVLTSSIFSAGVTALVSHLRFDGIAVGTVPGTGGAIGLYSEGVRGFSIRANIANVTSKAIAVEWIEVLMRLKPRHGTPRVGLARGLCSALVIHDGPYGTDLKMEGYPLVVPSDGGHLNLQITADMDMQYHRKSRKRLVIPCWVALESLGIDDPKAPVDPEGDRMYFDYFNITSLKLSLQINGKARKLPVDIYTLRGTSG